MHPDRGTGFASLPVGRPFKSACVRFLGVSCVPRGGRPFHWRRWPVPAGKGGYISNMDGRGGGRMGGRGSSGAGTASSAARGLSSAGIDQKLVNQLPGTKGELEQAKEALYAPIEQHNITMRRNETLLDRQSRNPVMMERVAQHDYIAEDAPRRYAEKVNTAFRLGAGEDNFNARTVINSRSYWDAFFYEAVSEADAYARRHIRWQNGRIVRR